LRLVQPVQELALVEEGRLGGVEKLGNVVGVDDARPETGESAAAIPDRQNDPVAEPIMLRAACALRDHPRIDQVLAREPLSCQGIHRGRPPARGIADLEDLERRGLQAAPHQILEHRCASRRRGELVTVV